MNTIKEFYEFKCQHASDINEHLPTLYKYAKQCKSVIEFGVRHVVSSWALAYANPKSLICVDMVKYPEVDQFIEICKNENQPIEFITDNTLSIDIPETDMLFIDTLHNYDQLKQELERHYMKVKKFILFHDIVSFGHSDESNPSGIGIVPAINEFIHSHENEWKWHEIYTNNNGLGIIAKI